MQARNVQVDRAAAKAAGFTVNGIDDLEVVEGIGPKICALLHNAGVHTFYELSQMSSAQIQVILQAGGPKFKLANPDSWPRQAGRRPITPFGAMIRPHWRHPPRWSPRWSPRRQRLPPALQQRMQRRKRRPLQHRRLLQPHCQQLHRLPSPSPHLRQPHAFISH